MHPPAKSEERGVALTSESGQLADTWCLYSNKHGSVCQPAQPSLFSVAACDATNQPILRGGCVCPHARTRKASLCLPSTFSHFPSAGTGVTGATGEHFRSLPQPLCAKVPRDHRNVSSPDRPPTPLSFGGVLLKEVAATGMMPTIWAGSTIVWFEAVLGVLTLVSGVEFGPPGKSGLIYFIVFKALSV